MVESNVSKEGNTVAQTLSNLTIGAKVKFGRFSVGSESPQPIMWTVVAKNHTNGTGVPSYPSNSVTLLTSQLISRMAFDAKEPMTTSNSRNLYGNNRYSLSNIDRWLNSDAEAGLWWMLTPAHSSDAPPDENGVEANPYKDKAGFLNAFTVAERQSLLDTSLAVRKSNVDGGQVELITRKVFLPSAAEVDMAAINYSPGLMWSYFSDYSKQCSLTAQARTNLPSNALPSSPERDIDWWVRTPLQNSGCHVQCVNANGWANPDTHVYKVAGVRPAINLSAELPVSDTTDTDGCYTILLNNAPPAPSDILVPQPLVEKRTTTISWSPVVDPDGDEVSYRLEGTYSSAGNAFLPLGTTTATSWTFTVPSSDVMSKVQFRVCAIDAMGATSDYKYSLIYDILSNHPPIISLPTPARFPYDKGFTIEYDVYDSEGDSVGVIESIDGEQIRYYDVTTSTNTFDVTGNTWASLSNGSHTLEITALDSGGASITATYSFIKASTYLSILTSPMVATSRPVRLSLEVARNIPGQAIFKVEVCNNGNDAEPTWEDATSSVTGALVHVFENTSKTADNWAIRIRVTVDRNGAEGLCYISGIGGNYE